MNRRAGDRHGRDNFADLFLEHDAEMGEVLEGLKALAAGFVTTLRHLFRRPITEEYPEYKRPLPARSRAR
ncbi:MAG TPA: hypothetical protein VES58_08885, partial [Syntrophobacteria bacterium]|nr:hypothetical protein [Syntrophobacteria bacterium]